MKFNTQLVTLIIASSIKAQQQYNNINISDLINSAILALDNILPSDQVQIIATALNNGINQSLPTRNPTTITAINPNTDSASSDGSIAQATPTGDSVNTADSSNTISATPTDSNSASPTDSSNATDDSNNDSSNSTDSSDTSDDSNSDSATPTDSSDSSTSPSTAATPPSDQSTSSSSTNLQSSGSQICAPSKFNYVASSVIFTLIGSYLI